MTKIFTGQLHKKLGQIFLHICLIKKRLKECLESLEISIIINTLSHTHSRTHTHTHRQTRPQVKVRVTRASTSEHGDTEDQASTWLVGVGGVADESKVS